MSAFPGNGDADPNNATAHQSVRALMDMARQHFDDEELGIALVSAGARLMASVYGTEPAIVPLRRATRELHRMKPE
jgi:hypothetical protein